MSRNSRKPDAGKYKQTPLQQRNSATEAWFRVAPFGRGGWDLELKTCSLCVITLLQPNAER